MDFNNRLQKIRDTMFPQLEYDLLMFLRNNSPEISKAVLFYVSELNSGKKVHVIDRTMFDSLPFPEQVDASFAVLNFARKNGGRFFKAYYPLYGIYDQQEAVWNENYVGTAAGKLAQKNVKKEMLDSHIAEIEERNEAFEKELLSFANNLD